MTQAQSNQKNTPLGAQAAAAVTGAAKTADAKPDDKKTDAKPDDKKTRTARKVFVVVGEVHEFESVNKAEKFLNADGAPTTYSVLRGNRIGTSKKVSLR